jgi:hypothetical protein
VHGKPGRVAKVTESGHMLDVEIDVDDDPIPGQTTLTGVPGVDDDGSWDQ